MATITIPTTPTTGDLALLGAATTAWKTLPYPIHSAFGSSGSFTAQHTVCSLCPVRGGVTYSGVVVAHATIGSAYTKLQVAAFTVGGVSLAVSSDQKALATGSTPLMVQYPFTAGFTPAVDGAAYAAFYADATMPNLFRVGNNLLGNVFGSGAPLTFDVNSGAAIAASLTLAGGAASNAYCIGFY